MSAYSVIPSPTTASTDPAADPSAFTRERQATFLAALAGTGSVRSASARAGISHQTAYRARLASPGFRRAWEAAMLAARAQAEEVLACRALDGWEEDVIYHGEVVATRRRYSDRLLLAHLARLDRLVSDVEVAQFADAFDETLARFAAGEDRPARVVEAAAAGAEISAPGEWSMRSTVDGAEADPGMPPPLAPVMDAQGQEMSEVQQLEVGLYQHWWHADLECWLTNWPAPEGWAGREYRIDPVGGAATPLEPHPDDPALDADGADWPGLDHRARTLSAAEEAGLAARDAAVVARDAAMAAQRAGRLELYRRAHFGLGGAGLAAALEAVNGGGWQARVG